MVGRVIVSVALFWGTLSYAAEHNVRDVYQRYQPLLAKVSGVVNVGTSTCAAFTPVVSVSYHPDFPTDNCIAVEFSDAAAFNSATQVFSDVVLDGFWLFLVHPLTDPGVIVHN